MSTKNSSSFVETCEMQDESHYVVLGGNFVRFKPDGYSTITRFVT